MKFLLSETEINKAYENIRETVRKTPLEYSTRLSEKYNSNIYIKREDLQEVRSYKIRGAYNLISSLSQSEKDAGVVCASAGNHAQGFAYSCSKLKIKGVIFMPEITPRQKLSKVKSFGKEYVEIILTGRTFDECSTEAKKYTEMHNMIFVHPFDDLRTIAGQGTVGKEILDEIKDIEVIICPIGGGGLISGIASYCKSVNPNIKIFGVDPKGASKVFEAISNKGPITLSKIDTFVDGAAVKRVGDITFSIISQLVDKVVVSQEGKVCTTMIELYQNDGIISEPAGALAISSLDLFINDIKGKNVVCILSGGNNDILRYPEVMERSLVYEGLKHYFIIEFAQKPGQLKELVERVLGPNDDIVRFEYIKKTNKEIGPALVGIEFISKSDFQPFIKRLSEYGFNFVDITNDPVLSEYLI